MKILERIYIEGFRSIQKLEFTFNRKGVYLIQGRNGSGKSTITEAVYYALFGDTIKSTNMADIPTKTAYRDKSFKGTKVELHFTLDDNTKYSIIRHIAYGNDRTNETIITKEGNVIPVTDKADAQAKINTILGMSAKIFKNSVFFAQKGVRVIDSKDAERRELFEELFDVGLDIYEAKAKVKFQEEENIRQTLISNKSNLEFKLNSLRETYDKYKKMVESFEEDKEKNILEVEGYIKAIENELKQYPDDLVEVVSLPPVSEEALYNTKLAFQAAQNVHKAVKLKLDSLIPPNDKCPTCKGSISSEIYTTLHNEYLTKKEELELQLETALLDVGKKDLEIKKQHDIYLEMRAKYLENQDLILRNNSIEKKRQELKSNISIYEKNKTKLIDSKCLISEEVLNNQYRDIKNTENEILSIKETLKEKQAIIDSYKYWANTGFTFKGMKSFILQAMLQNLNNSLLQYSERLGLLVNVSLKMETKSKSFDITITDTSNVSKNYNSLSGGEQKRVDIILSFALHDIISQEFSLLVVDEFFEGLDEEGLDIAMSLLREKSKHQAVYMVTHNINIDMSECETISVIKENNFTKIL